MNKVKVQELKQKIAESIEQQLIDSVKNLCQTKFNGNYQTGFNYYANTNGVIDKQGIEKLLVDINVGSNWTRGLIADAIIAQLDTNGDGVIEWLEFAAVL